MDMCRPVLLVPPPPFPALWVCWRSDEPGDEKKRNIGWLAGDTATIEGGNCRKVVDLKWMVEWRLKRT